MRMMQRRGEGLWLEDEADRDQHTEGEEEDEIEDEENFTDCLHKPYNT